MFREMRRKKQVLPESDCLSILDRGTAGVLALSGDDGYPYAVPISYVREGDTLYFHCAQEGRKLELLRRFPQVCVTFVGDDRPAFVPPAMYTTYFQSAIVTGTASEVTDPEEKTAALRALCQKLTPEHMDSFEAAVKTSLAVTAVWKIHMEDITGKAKLEK